MKTGRAALGLTPRFSDAQIMADWNFIKWAGCFTPTIASPNGFWTVENAMRSV